MVISHSPSSRRSIRRIRPISLNRDAQAVMRLLRNVFGSTLDADARRALNSMATTPALLMRFSHWTSRFEPGFIFEEDGHIVGNVSLIPTRSAQRVIIANVAVHPDFRRQHIARQLMETALTHLIERDVKRVFLQVDTHNTGAITLYDRLHFNWLGSTTQWMAGSGQWHEIPAANPIDIRQLRNNEHRKAFNIDSACFVPDLNWPEPLALDTYRKSLQRRLSDFMNGRQFETWVIPNEHDEPVAIGSIWSEWGRPHRMSLRIPEGLQASLAQPLLAKLLRRLSYLRPRRVLIEHTTTDELTHTLLRHARFEQRRTLGTMHLELDSQ